MLPSISHSISSIIWFKYYTYDGFNSLSSELLVIEQLTFYRLSNDFLALIIEFIGIILLSLIAFSSFSETSFSLDYIFLFILLLF